MGRAVIGVDLGGTNLRTALLSSDGEILVRNKEATQVSKGWNHVVTRIKETIALHRDHALERGLEIVAVGVGAPGIIELETGVVVKSPNFPDWTDVPLRAELEKALRLPVFLENDANAAALGEQWRGAASGISTMLLLTLGTGVGGGIVLNNRIFHGADGMAGEIGHMTLVPDGRLCSCGNTGCLEMYASARGILQSYQEKLHKEVSTGLGTGVTAEKIYHAAQAGDPIALQVMQDMGRMLGIGLASLINIFNPEMVVLGGGVKDAWQLFIEATREEIVKRAFPVPARRAQIVPSMLGDDAGMTGAAALAFQKLNS